MSKGNAGAVEWVREVDLETIMQSYDKLPKELRAAVGDAWVPFDTIEILQVYNHGVPVALIKQQMLERQRKLVASTTYDPRVLS